MLGKIFYKNNFSDTEYAVAAEWCNANNAMIVDNDDYYEVVAIPAPALDELKAAKIAELKAQRDTAEVQPIEYNGMEYDYDTNARERINAAIIALDVAGNNVSIEWTLANNTTAMVTADDLRKVVAAVAMRSNSLHIAYRQAKEKVEAAQTVEELQAITL